MLPIFRNFKNIVNLYIRYIFIGNFGNVGNISAEKSFSKMPQNIDSIRAQRCFTNFSKSVTNENRLFLGNKNQQKNR